jgi:hypothetical protein
MTLSFEIWLEATRPYHLRVQDLCEKEVKEMKLLLLSSGAWSKSVDAKLAIQSHLDEKSKDSFEPLSPLAFFAENEFVEFTSSNKPLAGKVLLSCRHGDESSETEEKFSHEIHWLTPMVVCVGNGKLSTNLDAGIPLSKDTFPLEIPKGLLDFRTTNRVTIPLFQPRLELVGEVQSC